MMRRVSRRQKRSIAKFKTLVPSVDDAFEMGLSSPISMFYAFDNEPSRILFRDTKKIPKFIQDHDCYPEYIEALDAYKKGIEEGLRDRGDRDLFL